MNYKIELFSCKISPELEELYKRRFPLRKHPDYINFILCSSPFNDFNSSYILGFVDDNIEAMIFSIVGRVHFIGESHNCIFGCDYYTSLQHRNSPLGAAILRKLLKNNIHFALGPKLNGISYKLHTVYKEKHFANCNIYLGVNYKTIFRFFSWIVKSKLKGEDFLEISNERFPNQFQTRGFIFKLISKAENLYVQAHRKKWMHDSILEFDRSVEYISWRFFKAPHKYFLYEIYDTKQKLKGFAVFRHAYFRSFLPSLVLVDYRYDDQDTLFAILEFSDTLFSMVEIPFLLLPNSLTDNEKIFDERYKCIHKFPLLSNLPGIDNVKNYMVTLADSDLELNKYN